MIKININEKEQEIKIEGGGREIVNNLVLILETISESTPELLLIALKKSGAIDKVSKVIDEWSTRNAKNDSDN